MNAFSPPGLVTDRRGPMIASEANAGHVVSLGRHATVYEDGLPAEHWYEVVCGAVRACKLMRDGRRQVLHFHLPGDAFGLGSGGMHEHAAEIASGEATILVRHGRRALENRARTDPLLAYRLRTMALQELLQAHARLLLLGRKTAVERVAAFLLEMAERLPHGPGSDSFVLPMGREDIADHLGLTIETVSRTLSELHRGGLIALSGRREVSIPDPVALGTLNGWQRPAAAGRVKG